MTDLPGAWEDRSLITLVGPVGRSGFAANVVITRQPISPHTSIEDYARQQRDLMQAGIPELQILDARPTRINGAPAYQQLQRFRSNNRRLQQAQTFLLGDRIIYAITCTAALEEFDTHTPAFRHIVESFRLFDAQTANL